MDFQEMNLKILEMLKKPTNAKVWEALKGTLSGINENNLQVLVNEETKVVISVKLPSIKEYSEYLLRIEATEYYFDTKYEGWSDQLDNFCAILMRKLEIKTDIDVRISYSSAEQFAATGEIKLSWKLS